MTELWLKRVSREETFWNKISVLLSVDFPAPVSPTKRYNDWVLASWTIVCKMYRVLNEVGESWRFHAPNDSALARIFYDKAEPFCAFVFFELCLP